MWSTKSQIVIVLLLFCIPSMAAAQELQERKPTGNSIIMGRVIYSDTGRPVRRATVMLYRDVNGSEARVTPANARGEFRFNEVDGGTYFVVAEAPGILSPLSAFSISELGFGGNRENDYTRVTVDGKNSIRCEVRAIRAGTIKGTITYDDKEPVVKGRIVLYRRSGNAMGPFFTKPVTTNDRGMYRIDGLPDGEYVVGLAYGEITSREPRDEIGEVAGITNAFYPGVRTLSEAKPIQIQSGSEVANVDMTLNDDVLRQISGTVKWKSGKLVTEGGVSLRRKGDPNPNMSFSSFMRLGSFRDDDDDQLFSSLPMLILTMPPTAPLNDNGEWILKDLPPGTYVVTALAQLPEPDNAPEKKQNDIQPPPIEDERRFVSRQVELTLDQEDLENVTIELSEGGRILGTVALADSSPAPKVTISVREKGADEFILNMPAGSQQDGTFIIDGVPAGEVLIDVDVPRYADFYLQSITAGSRDLMREPLRMEEGAQISGVRITLNQGSATLSGRVQLSEGGKDAAGAGVLLAPADPALWRLASLRRFTSTNASGEFMVRCPPGDYLVFTWASGDQPLQNLENFIRAQAGNGRRITLQSKEEKQLELTIPAPGK